MPATFAHCLMAQKAIDTIQKRIIKEAKPEYMADFAQKIGEKNNFVITGAAGPDYPYCTDILMTSVLPIKHTWANRMHYENTLSFVREGVKQLNLLDKTTEAFAIRLAWFCGFVSHIVADSYIHPVVNSIVGGTYIFTHEEHGKCELIQDAYIFKKITKEDIVSSNPKGGNFGYLSILEESSDPNDEHKSGIHPDVRDFWIQLLKSAHPNAKAYFEDISPNKWHYNYTGKVNFIVDPGAIFRHVVGLTGRNYQKETEISDQDRKKYITKILFPNGKKSDYDTLFNDAINLIVDVWLNVFENVSNGDSKAVSEYVKDWNLDTGVDESQIYFWKLKEA